MLLKLIIILLLIVCLGSILISYRKVKEKFNDYTTQSILQSNLKTSNLEKYIAMITETFVLIIISIILLSVLFNFYHEYILVTLIIAYLLFYYINQYLPHARWIIIKEGFMSNRSRIAIEWQNIKNYRWLSQQADKSILILEFKGKGLITQRADFLVETRLKQQVEQLLNERVIMS